MCNPIRCSNKEAPNKAEAMRTIVCSYHVLPLGSTKRNYYIWVFCFESMKGNSMRPAVLDCIHSGEFMDAVSTLDTQSIAVDVPKSAVHIDLFCSHQMNFDYRIEAITIINENVRTKFTCSMLVQAYVSHCARRLAVAIHFVGDAQFISFKS